MPHVAAISGLAVEFPASAGHFMKGRPIQG
jgi:hypothetical protein